MNIGLPNKKYCYNGKKGIVKTKAAKKYQMPISQFFNQTKAYLGHGIRGLKNKKRIYKP